MGECWSGSPEYGASALLLPRLGSPSLEANESPPDMMSLGLRRIMQSALPVSYRLPFVRALSSRAPLVLMYHGVPRRHHDAGVDAAVFERHILFLKQYCSFLRPDGIGERRKALDKIAVLLTFDDGMRNQATVAAPILRRLNIPAMFFVCSRPATPGKYLWFEYMRALERYFPTTGFWFRGELVDMTPAQRRVSVERLFAFLLNLTPHPRAMYQVIEDELPPLSDFVSLEVIEDAHTGMTAEQVGELAASELFSVGIHTVDHPFLTKCDPREMTDQIQRNQTWIEDVCGSPSKSIAYPLGDYNAEVMETCGQLGIRHGYAVIPNANSGSPYEIPRVGVYATSLDVLGFKTHWGNHIRTLRLGVG